MKKERIVKSLVTVVYFLVALVFILELIRVAKNPDSLGINVVCSLMTMPVAIPSAVMGIVSLKNIFSQNVKVTTFDKVVLIIFSGNIILAIVMYLIYSYFNII